MTLLEPSQAEPLGPQQNCRHKSGGCHHDDADDHPGVGLPLIPGATWALISNVGAPLGCTWRLDTVPVLKLGC